MWFWLLLLAAAIATSESLLRLPWWGQFGLMRASARKSMRILRSARISDHWKERALPAYARVMARASVIFLLLLSLGLVPMLALGLLFPGGVSVWTAALMQPLPLAALCAVSLGWLVWRRPGANRAARSGSDAYSPLDKALHRLALGSPTIAAMSHDIERAAFLRSAPQPAGGPVIVTGLARAGTTILMRELHGTGVFGSLTYADMPFVLAPNLWAALSGRGRRPGPRREREHGDGIEVDSQSPEALDEVYWRSLDGDAYIRPEGLLPHFPDSALIDGYRDLMRLVLRRTGKRRYLSKNNNMILRLRTLALAMPDACFLIPLRDPLQHAQSLLDQHRRFKRSDPFTQDYMTWLGHHEFGATHRPFLLAEGQGAPGGNPDSLDYWLRLWIAVHLHLESIAADVSNVLFLPSARLAADPVVWHRLAQRLDIATPAPQEIRPIPPRPVTGQDPTLTAQAFGVYQRLEQQAALP